MSPAGLSLAALLVAIVASSVTSWNVGVLAIALAWLVAWYGGIALNDVLAGFPVSLFLTLTGVTMLFSQAQQNGTLEKVAERALRLCRGNAGLVPMMFFALCCLLASLGPGHIATTALVAPMAMSVAARARIPAFLMAIMVGHGATAGSLSPVAPTGIIVSGIMTRIGLPGYEWPTYLNNLAAQTLVAFAGYFAFGGWRLFGFSYAGTDEAAAPPARARLDRANWLTLGVIAALLVGVLALGMNVGMAAFAGAVLLAALRVADHDAAIRRMPWNVILMVSGVTVLIALLEKTQGLDLFTALLARWATPDTITGFIAFVTGLVSVYSSTSGVVLPAFLPTIPGLVARLGGGDPVAIASAINVGGHLVDVSPLSTIGALCIAGLVPGTEDARVLFNRLLAWGLSMTAVGALACALMF
ncbi:MAG: C4-dicarboxylate ABC transporter [Acidobacteria bacterium]|nr:C4-dicarboxylate ABC transporter [Acidobacteriota bacterium]